jgi:hypothetical protein
MAVSRATIGIIGLAATHSINKTCHCGVCHLYIVVLNVTILNIILLIVMMSNFQIAR